MCASICAGLEDEMHLAIAPALLGEGEALLTGIDAEFGLRGHRTCAHAERDTYGVRQGAMRAKTSGAFLLA